jgi:hypothetical protein
VNLLTLKHLGDKQILLRLGHIYAFDESPMELAKSASVNLKVKII